MRFLLTLAMLLAWLLPGSYAFSPVPKEKNKPKTTAEKLVGEWRKIVMGGQPVSHELDATMEFTTDGKVIFRSTDPKRGYKKETGIYKLADQTIHLTVESRPKAEHRQWSVTIKEITERKVVIAGPDTKPGQENEYVRVEPSGRK